MRSYEEIKKSIDDLYKTTNGEKNIMLEEMKEKAARDELSRIEWEREQGRREGMRQAKIELEKEGIKKAKIESVKNLLLMEVDIEIIAKGIGLTIEEIEEMKKSISYYI